MVTILTISFGGPKHYDYLLDSRSVFVPKPKDVIFQPKSYTRYGMRAQKMTVVKVSQVAHTPAHVTAIIYINDKIGKTCKISQIKTTTIDIIKKPAPTKTYQIIEQQLFQSLCQYIKQLGGK